jgi:6-pyruvoyltetrahydropterin/6-carboxytetrahydropterin synthase
MFEISVEQTFAAAHALRNYKGRCENVHGHNFRVRVKIEGERLDEAGLLVYFLDLKARMGAVIEHLDHQYLNEIPPFDVKNPSAENLAEYFYHEISVHLPETATPVSIREVTVWETDIQSASYRP